MGVENSIPGNVADTYLAWRDPRTGLALATAFAVAFGIALTSGLFYWLAPPRWNWNASQLALVVHLAAGVFTVLVLAPFVLIHQKDRDGSRGYLAAPWLLARAQERSRGNHAERVKGHSFAWSLLVLEVTGLMLAVPGVLYLAGEVWTPPYGSHRWLVWLHLGATAAALAAALAHLPLAAARGATR